MNRTTTLLARAAAVAALLAAGALPAAAAVRGPYTLEVLVDGRAIDEYAARDKTYVEATEGREYALRFTNRTGRRVAVALSVDGLNTIDAKSGPAREATKWIVGPWDSITISGWQTSVSTARRFFFTTEARSYGAWLGRADDLGVIAAAVFRERVPRDRSRPIQSPRAERDAPAPGAAREGAAAPRRAQTESKALSDDLAATGIGRETRHQVRGVEFDEEPEPAAVIALRYEYRDALVRLGVLPRDGDALARRERARGFSDLEFAPSP